MILKPQLAFLGTYRMYEVGDYLVVEDFNPSTYCINATELGNTLFADPEGIDEAVFLAAAMNALKDGNIIALYFRGKPIEVSAVKHFRYPNVLTPENVLYWDGEIYTFDDFQKVTA
jgi:hypothetical protein